MESSKKLLVLGFALIGLVVLPCTCSATMTVSIDTDKSSYYLGENVNFTAEVVIVNESGGCCDLNSVTFEVIGEHSMNCSLPTGEWSDPEFDCGDYTFDIVVNETNLDCHAYGGDNTYGYTINWKIPSGWSTGAYTAKITVSACGDLKENTTGFSVTTPPTTTTIRYRSRGGGGGGGPAYVARIKPSCFDGIKNCHDGGCEEGIDCGGPCRACPSCSDGIQNQGETGVDCGGPCPPCRVTTTTVRPEVTTTVATTTTTTTTTTTSITTTTIVHAALTTTTMPPSPGIPLGITEGAIILTAIVLITIAFMIQTGRI